MLIMIRVGVAPRTWVARAGWVRDAAAGASHHFQVYAQLHVAVGRRVGERISHSRYANTQIQAADG